MKKLYCFFFIAFISQHLYSQLKPVTVERTKLSDSRIAFIDKKTHTNVNDLVWEEAESFVNGFAKVYAGNRWGFVDGSGNAVIKAEYESLRNFVNHLAAAQKNSKWGFINEKGTVVVPFEYDIIYDLKEEVTAGYKNNTWFLINKTGVVTRTLDIDIFKGFNKGTAKIIRQGRPGLMNTKGDIISIEPEKKSGLLKTNTTAARNASQQAGVCPANIDFEMNSFTNWSCYIGDVRAVNNQNQITVTPSPPTANRHVIYASTNPSAIDPYGLFPINPPDGTGHALKLGNDVNGAEAERVSYTINVPANAVDASITYRYAVVFQDPGHLTYEQPRFSAMLFDVAANTYLPCASYEYISTSSLPGFNVSPVDDSVKYKSWASVFINLSAYAGKTLVLEFTTADCTKGGHWGYTYVDVGDCDITADIQYTCNPNIATMSGPPGFEQYNWWSSNFDSLYGTGQNITLNPAPSLGSSVFVEVIPYNGFGCSDTLRVNVATTFPLANAGPDKTICPGTPVSIGTTAVPGNSYSWSPAINLSNPNVAMPNSNAIVSTPYTLTVTNIATGCSTQDIVNVNVSPKPKAGFDPGPAQCFSGNSFTFDDTSTVSSGSLTYNWTFGDGGSSTQANPVHSYANAGVYSVKLVVTSNGGCEDSVTHPAVTVNANPQVKTNNDIAICRGSSVQLQTTGAQTYEWVATPTLSCTDCPNPVASPLNNTSYIVRGIDNYGCDAYDTLAITVHQPISINVSPDRTICEGQTVNLLATGSAASFAWSPSQGLSAINITNPVAAPAATTQYRVVGYDGHNCFTDTGYVTITVNPNPVLDIGPDLTLSTGTVYTLTPVTQNGPIISWNWYPSNDLSCNNCDEPSVTVKKDIIYHADITNIYGCRTTDSIRIKAFCEGSQVFIPNAFTPDGDGRNDILMVRAKGIQAVRSFRIYTRWGELIFDRSNFSPNDPTNGWDGRIKGVKGAPEVYVYTVEVICDNLQTYSFKGNITILK